VEILVENLRAKVRARRDRAAAGEITMTIEVAEFLVEWLKQHTADSDRRIGEYLERSPERG
jgi:hemerythrin